MKHPMRYRRASDWKVRQCEWFEDDGRVGLPQLKIKQNKTEHGWLRNRKPGNPTTRDPSTPIRVLSEVFEILMDLQNANQTVPHTY